MFSPFWVADNQQPKSVAVLPRLQRVKIKERLPGGIRLVLLAKAFVESGGVKPLKLKPSSSASGQAIASTGFSAVLPWFDLTDDQFCIQ